MLRLQKVAGNFKNGLDVSDFGSFLVPNFHENI